MIDLMEKSNQGRKSNDQWFEMVLPDGLKNEIQGTDSGPPLD
jgi:hypothetical protein